MVQIEGTYTHTKTKESCDFWVKNGAPKELAEKLVNTHWTMKFCKAGEKKWMGRITCDELPEMNQLDCYEEGVEKCIDHALFGGKAKLQFCMNSSKDGFNCKVQTEAFGNFEWNEKYTDEGLTIVVTKGGNSFSEFWQRKVKFYGSYRCVKHEGLLAFMKSSGVPADMMSGYDDFRFTLSGCGDWHVLTERFGDFTIVNKFKGNEEYTYTFPDDVFPPMKGVTTKVGCDTLKSVFKFQDGHVEEWTMKFCDQGAKICGLNQRTGDKCCLHLERYHEFSGTYRPVSFCGVKEMAAALGIPSDLACKMATDFDSRVIVCEKNGVIHHTHKSKFTPLDVCCKVGEETEFFHPIFKENVKMVLCKNGNKMTSCLCTSKGMFKGCCTFGDTFVVAENRICGMDLCITTILMRC